MTIIPVPNTQNYIRISQISYLCKTMERIINTILTWFLEKHIKTKYQCVFRNKRRMVDHLLTLETHIRKENIIKKGLIPVFFDLEKAYDTILKYGIMKYQHKFGLRNRIPYIISNFLAEVCFWGFERVGLTLSNPQKQKEVPQGNILLVTLFSIKINNIVNCLGLNALYMWMTYRYAIN